MPKSRWIPAWCGPSLALVALVGLPFSASGCGSSSSGSSPVTYDAGAADAAGISNATCEATVLQGPMKGTLSTDTCEYLGVRYGAPPTGTLRFAPPHPASAWKGTLDASKFGNTCMQGSSLGSVMGGGSGESEDCLFVNVYTPQHLPSKALPVMVFIHGGAYTLGAGSEYDPKALSETGPVVAITFNYRLGALGFLATPELDAERTGAPSGSDGIRDQQLAIQWVKNNARSFGGDPANITVFGESAGAMSTCIHIVSPGSQGLAERFVMESGSCVHGPQLGTKADRYTLSGDLLAALCPAAADAGTGGLACLRAADAGAISTWAPTTAELAALGGTTALFGNALGAPFYPIVEGPAGVLPDSPENLIRAGMFAKTASFISGTNAHEWGLFAVTLPGLIGATNLQVTTMAQLDQGIVQLFGASKAAMVEAQYPATDATAQQVYIDLVTDAEFRCPTRDLARLTLAHGASSYFLYSYEFGRAYHSDELPNLFAGSVVTLLGATAPTPALAKDMKTYWTQMAAGGTPNGAGTSVMWPAYATATDAHLVLADPPVAGTHLDQANCDFWDTFNGFSP